MKITSISAQVRDPNRVNVSIDGRYRFSLDISQLMDLEVKVGRELDDDELAVLEEESQFGKLYARVLEYSLMRPRSQREVQDYLYRKTLTTKYKNRQGEVAEKKGYSPALADRVLERLIEKRYVDDAQFARFWIENRHIRGGISRRRLVAELRAKGVSTAIVDEALAESERSDESELHKMIEKKRDRYPDEQKLVQYLLRQGFSYDAIKAELVIDGE